MFKMSVQLKPEVFLLGLMDKQLEKKRVSFFFLRQPQQAFWMDRDENSLQIPTMEQWTVKLLDLAEMTKLATLILKKD